MFNETLSEVTAKLSEAKAAGKIEDFCLIGGLAVAARGYVRATDDIDFALICNSKHCSEIAKSFGAQYSQGEISDPLAGVFLMEEIGGNPYRPRVQMIRFWPNIEKIVLGNIEIVNFETSQIPIINTTALILLKLLAGSEQDLLDAKQILQANELSETQLAELSAWANDFSLTLPTKS